MLFNLVILQLSGVLMSNCSLKPTNNAGWKVPLLEGAPHCCCWVLQPRVVQNANVFEVFENPDSRLFSRLDDNVTIQSGLTLKTSTAAFLDMSKWACVLTSELDVTHNRFLWSNIASWRSVQRRFEQSEDQVNFDSQRFLMWAVQG